MERRGIISIKYFITVFSILVAVFFYIIASFCSLIEVFLYLIDTFYSLIEVFLYLIDTFCSLIEVFLYLIERILVSNTHCFLVIISIANYNAEIYLLAMPD